MAYPVSTSNFKTIVSKNFDFVDKSLMIKDIVDQKSGAFLFTRPRRFGKTMNLNMLDAFFNCDCKDNDKLFSKLKISKVPDAMEHLGKYKVIHLDFSSIESIDKEMLLRKTSLMLSELFIKFNGLLNNPDMDESERKYFNEIKNGTMNEALMHRAITLLCKWIKTTEDMEVVILIDEYDKPAHKAYLSKFYDEFFDFFTPFMEATLKTNQDYRFAIVTGVSRISKQTLFSGLNNLMEFDIFQTRYDESFGFTESEIKELLSKADIPIEEMEKIKAYYDGYRFGKEDVYNPFSVMRYLSNYVDGNTEPQSYWVQSGDVSLITDTLSKTDPEFRDRIISLGVPGNTMTCEINPRLSVRHLSSTNENQLEDATITLMVTSGYLKAVPVDNGIYEVSIPNTEVFDAFKTIVAYMKIVRSATASKFMEYIYNKDGRATTELNRILDGQSPRDHYDENTHKTFMSILFGYSGFRYQTELGSGNGFADLYIKATNKHPGILMELKYSDKKCDLEKLAEKALEQIDDRDYSRNIDGPHIKVGIAFHKHTAKIVFGKATIASESV